MSGPTRDELARELEQLAKAVRELPEEGPWVAHIALRLLDVSARAAIRMALPRVRFLEQAGQSFDDAQRRRAGAN